MAKSQLNSVIVVAACCGLSMVLGTIHAFSVFIPQWETQLGADRASVSLIYSLALISLTTAVLFGHRIYPRISPVVLFLLVGVLAAMGLYMSARSLSLHALYITYGVLFGGANGLGYGYALQLSGQAAPARRGIAMALVTAFYAVGATAAPWFFASLIQKGGNSLALEVMSGIVVFVSAVAGLFVFWFKARYISEPSESIQTLTPTLKSVRVMLWLGYGSAVTAGLMIIGHAYGIAIWTELDDNLATWATTAVAFGNMLGGFSAGYYADRVSSRVLLRWLPLFTSLGLIVLVLPVSLGWVLIFISIGLVGYCYGAIIAVYPVAVVDVFGAMAAPRIYGQVFTAWGLAGLLGPWISGRLFDMTESYSIALLIAVLLSVVSVIVIRQALPEN